MVTPCPRRPPFGIAKTFEKTKVPKNIPTAREYLGQLQINETDF